MSEEAGGNVQPIPGHRLISAHRCICGWEGDSAITHVMDALQADGWGLVPPTHKSRP